jgi:uncharacterized lipoprotein YehR (DUF1307 family)
MKRIILVFVAALGVFLVGCGKDAQINAFIAELDSTGKELIAKIDANMSAAGFEDAQKLFDSKKAGLKAKWDPIKGLRDYQVSYPTRARLKECVQANRDALIDIYDKNSSRPEMDKNAKAKLDALLADYDDFFSK